MLVIIKNNSQSVALFAILKLVSQTHNWLMTESGFNREHSDPFLSHHVSPFASFLHQASGGGKNTTKNPNEK